MRGRELSCLLLVLLSATALLGVALGAKDGTSPAAVSTKTIDCTTIHRACSTCQHKRMAGTRKTTLVCSTCMDGWRLRQDNTFKTCDCSPGFYLNGTTGANWCTPCSAPQYCSGGGASNPLSLPSNCTTGLATVSAGARSSSQCYTAPGYGGYYLKINGTVTYTVEQCQQGTYNPGRNTAGCQQCPHGLTTIAPGGSSYSSCVAPPGYYIDRGTAKYCPKGTYTDSFNSFPNCYVCNSGFTTEKEGTNSSAACNRVMAGYFMVNGTYAAPCPTGSYQHTEGTIYSCSNCPFGYITRDDGAGGTAECMAPPGWELKPGASMISECELGWYKEGWNKNPCISCGGSLTTVGRGAVAVDDCRVPRGYGIISLTPVITAVMCTQNTYGENATRAVVATSRCTSCSPGLYTLDVLLGVVATQGYYSEQDCLTKPGYGIEPSGAAEMCQEGTFNEGFNREPCASCPTLYTSIETGADSPDACVMRQGWAVDPATGLGTPCPAGSWSSGGTVDHPNATCVQCDTGYSTQTDQSVALEDCNVCEPGYGAATEGVAGCTLCGYNTFSYGGAASDMACIPCAPGSESRRGSTHNSQCYPTMVHADKDYYALNDDSQWTTDSTATSAVECQANCSANAACIMYRYGYDTQAEKCDMLLEAASGPRVIGFKSDSEIVDYVLYKIPATLQVGWLLADEGTKTPAECMAACSARGSCEVVQMDAAANLPSAAGPCRLFRSEYDADWQGMYHVQGNRLYSDSLIV